MNGKHFSLPEAVKFPLSSLTSFAVDYGLFNLGLWIFGKGVTAALCVNIAARVLSGTFNYFMNCRFVFRRSPAWKTAGGYFALALGILAGNSAVLALLTGVFHLPPRWAKLLTELILFAASWLIQRTLIFRKRKKDLP